jgi:hypothetical protein
MSESAHTTAATRRSVVFPSVSRGLESTIAHHHAARA